MLCATLLEFLLRGIPEGYLFIFAGYTFSKTRLNIKKFIFSGFLLGVIGYLVRFLPISFGVHSILILIACIVMLCSLHKIPVVKAISSGMITMLIMFAAEIVNGVLVTMLRGVRLTEIIHNVQQIDLEFENCVQKLLYGLPSILLVWLIVLIVYLIYKKKEKLSDASD